MRGRIVKPLLQQHRQFVQEEAGPPTLSSTGLVHWLPFNNDALDDSGNGNDWTLNGGAGYITNGFQSADVLELNVASSESASIADDPSYDCDGAFSVSLWMRTNDLGQDTTIFEKHFISGGTRNGIALFWESSAGGYWRTRCNNSFSSSPGDANADITADDTWYHIVMTRANATANILVYKNAGAAVTLTQSTTPTANTEPAVIGEHAGTYSELDVCEHTFWTRALSASDVSTLYNGGTRLTYADVTWV